jgi:hypothetical protein
MENESIQKLDKEKSLETTGFSNPVNVCYLLAFVLRSSCLLYYIIFLGRKAKSLVGDNYNHLKKTATKMNGMEKFAFPSF